MAKREDRDEIARQARIDLAGLHHAGRSKFDERMARHFARIKEQGTQGIKWGHSDRRAMRALVIVPLAALILLVCYLVLL